MESEQEIKTEKKTREGNDKKKEGAVYQINGKDCDKVYIGETKFKIEKKNRAT